MKGVHQADDPFVSFAAKPDKGFGLEILTWPVVGRERQSGSWEKEPRGRVGDGSAGWQLGSTPDIWETSRHEIESSSSEGRPVKMSQHSSSFVEISLEIHASVCLQMHK